MTKYFSVDARTLLTLGRDSIKDHTTAILELVKNGYDADASKVEIDIKKDGSRKDDYLIRIADDGCGMTEGEVEKFWLRIGFSQKRDARITDDYKRRKTGEKGIGRLSADRLGAILELRTRKRGATPYGLRICWDLFDKTGQDIGSVPIDDLPEGEKVPSVPASAAGNAKYGTELIIKQLRQSWEKEDIHALREELSLLTPPFSGIKRDFEISIQNDIDPDVNGRVASSFFDKAELEFKGVFSDSGVLTYTMKERKPGKRRDATVNGSVVWHKLTANALKKNVAEKNVPKFGKLEVRLLFYPKKLELLEGTELSLSDLTEFLRQNSGVKIYRDGIRVKPYGDPIHAEGDWLGLSARRISNPAGAGRKSFRIASNQLVGAVFLERDRNPALSDSSSREGLIHGDAFNDLRRAVLGCVYLLESKYHETFKERKKDGPTKAALAKENISRLNVDLKDLTTDLEKIKEQIPPKSGRLVESSRDQIQSIIDQIDTTVKSIEELASQGTIFRGLATVGISAAVFGHETQASLAATRQSMSLAVEHLTGDRVSVPEALSELRIAIKHAERTRQWGRFALLRVKNEKRKKSKVNIGVLIEGVIKDLRPAFTASGIELFQSINPIDTRTFPMDIESIVVNLLTNAYTACQQVSKNRKIRVALTSNVHGKRSGFRIEVADSGPGVQPEHLSRIWEPLFTTKIDTEGHPTGTGLGLTIIQSIVDELAGIKEIDRDPSLGGARFRIWIPT